jgi:hypothetical protein
MHNGEREGELDADFPLFSGRLHVYARFCTPAIAALHRPPGGIMARSTSIENRPYGTNSSLQILSDCISLSGRRASTDIRSN